MSLEFQQFHSSLVLASDKTNGYTVPTFWLTVIVFSYDSRKVIARPKIPWEFALRNLEFLKLHVL